MQDIRKFAWPLELIFLASFIAGFSGLVWTAVSNNEPGVFVWMIALALAVAILLHLPSFVDLLRTGALATKLDTMTATLQNVSGQLVTLGPALTTLRPNGAVPTSLNSIIAQIGPGGAVPVALADLKTAMDQLNEQLAANGPVRSSLQTIEAGGTIQNGIKGVNEVAGQIRDSVAQLRAAVADLNTKLGSAKTAPNQ